MPAAGAIRARQHYPLQMWWARSQQELIKAAQQGDGGAFDELLAPEYRAAFRVAYGLLQDIDEAEDAVQEATFKAWRKLGNLHEGSALRPWFLAIVANHCRALNRSRWRSVVRGELVRDERPEPETEAIVDLRHAVSNLSYEDKLVVVLRYYLDLPFEEIATIMNITPKAARRRVEKSIGRLRPALRPQEAMI